MKVTFTRTAERRYRVSVEGPGVVSSRMEPAPGYNARLPHDMTRFVVENELGIRGGVFGQLAGGGNARTFHPTDRQKNRKVGKRGKQIAAVNRAGASIMLKLPKFSTMIQLDVFRKFYSFRQKIKKEENKL